MAFRQPRGGGGLYESEIEDLLWANLDDLTGDVLSPIRRQAQISGGGRPDIVALDRSGSVVVIEVKRDVDRAQLAQCLEYAESNGGLIGPIVAVDPSAMVLSWCQGSVRRATIGVFLSGRCA